MIYKHGKKGIYRVKLMWCGKMICRSTFTTDKRVAGQVEAAIRNALAKYNVGTLDEKEIDAIIRGIGERKPLRSCPTVAEFAQKRFLPWVEATFQAKSKTKFYYRNRVHALLSFPTLAEAKLDSVTGEDAAAYAAYRRSSFIKSTKNKAKRPTAEASELTIHRPPEIATVNRDLQVLRRLLRLAVEWGELDKAPKIKLLRGEHHREFVLQPAEEAKYLAAAPEPLASFATVLVDTGLRPEEAYRLRWEDLTWVNGRHGTLKVTHGKTKAARRLIPMTPRVRTVLEDLWSKAGKPVEGWVWPSATKSGHAEPSTFKKQHRRTLKNSGVRKFVLYSLRHTFLTRLGASGVDVWTLARIAGHSSIAISARYVHPSDGNVLDALNRASLVANLDQKSTPET